MAKSIKDLQPAEFWKHFQKITSIPRCSGNETAIREYIISIAKDEGLKYAVDEKGNLVVSKGGTEGYENAPIVILQGHMDMVCEKNKGVEHDFSRDPIKLKIDGDYLKAEETSLGADNGVGIASSLSIMESKDLSHPPMEFLFTVEEEVGLNGAKFLTSDFLKGRIMLNLDSEQEGDFFVGCAGGLDGEIMIDIIKEVAPSDTRPYLVKVSGLRGGHSGLEIDKGHANAIKVLNRFLWNIMKDTNIRIETFSGGSKRNAIAREAEAVVWILDNKLELLKDKMKQWEQIFRKEFGKTEPNLKFDEPVTVDEISSRYVLSSKTAQTMLNVIYALPHGVVTMSRDIPNLVETSTNLGIVKTDKENIILTLNHRSSSATAILEVAEGIESLAKLAGVKYLRGPGYPGWQPDLDSKILGLARETYRKLFNKEANIKAIHAGLECGIIGEKFPGIDMLSFGPTMHSVHSPDEKLYIPSVEPFWKFLVELIKNVK
ncbi:MAG TPA: aminoacyl-histidine dipeptidase [Candidatus Eremiobacteraeota bacterium]|mgnify:CR=1 FL=1|nr:MAG: Cytosol non-specific dipeptidase [bacterium ADurb.Bin363]HPZ08686.1 aminoacyl-histidine dipeptidase [Candidatus Eremiobacteraeota bacterium]